MAGTAADQTGVALVEPHARHGARIDFHGPAALSAAHEDIGNHVFRGATTDHRAGPRMAGAHERQRLVDGFFVRADGAAQLAGITPGDEIEMMLGDALRHIETFRARIELAELQQDALADRAGGDADRIEHLHEHQHALDFFLVADDLRAQRRGDVGQGVRDVSVVVDRIDNRRGDGKVGRRQAGEFEL